MDKIGVAKIGLPKDPPEDLMNQITQYFNNGPEYERMIVNVKKYQRLIEFEE